MLVAFGPWRPDLADLDAGCTEATNVVPGVGAYEPQASLAIFASPLGSRCLGAISVVDTAGNAYWFAGDRRHLYLINSSTTSWSDVSNIVLLALTPDGFAVPAAFGEAPVIIPFGHTASFVIPTPTIAIADFLFTAGHAVPAIFSRPPLIIPQGFATSAVVGLPTVSIEDTGAGYTPSDSNLIEAGRSVLNYMSGLTALGSARLLSGQYHFDHCQTIFNETGHWPAMCSENATTGGNSGGTWPRIMSTSDRNNLKIYWDAGGIPVMHGTFSNPKTHGFMRDPDFNPADMDAVVTENGNAINRDFLVEVDLVVDLLLWFQDLGIPIVFRPFYEFAQGGTWYGSRDGTNYTAMQNRWKALWRYFWTYMENHGVHNCIRVFAGTQFQGTGHPDNFGAGFYPGDAWVDIAGVDMYKDLSGTTQWTDVTQNNLIRGVSSARIQAFPEYGQQMLASPGLHTDYRKLLHLSKDLFPYATYWMSWSSVWSMRAADNNFVSETLNDPWVVNREDLPNFSGRSGIITPIRGFYMPSYQTDELLTSDVEDQLDAMAAIGANRAVLALHLRTPSTTSNTVSRGPISENVANLSAWFSLARSKDLNPSLAFILSIDQFDWAGFWNPSNKALAMANYYAAVRPWVQEAEAAGLDYIVLTDEWSTLYASAASVTPFTTLINSARADYRGNIGFNVSNREEGDINTTVVSLLDFVGINAYIPLSTENSPTVAELYSNLVNPSDVPSVFSIYGNIGYTTYIRNLATSWGKPIIMTTGYQSTVGAAKDPSGQPQTVEDQAIQRDCWDAFLQALSQFNSLGVTGWRWWPGSTDDDGAQGFKVQGKLASDVFATEWGPPPAGTDIFYNPFNKNSAHHRPIGTGATYAGAGDPAVIDFLKTNFTVVNVGRPYGTFVIQNASSQPIKTVNWNGNGTGNNMPVTLKMPDLTDPNPTPDLDDTVKIYNVAGGTSAAINTLYEFFEFDWKNGVPTASASRSYLLTSLGHGTTAGQRVGSSASGASTLFGASRGFEINDDSTGDICHVMQLLAESRGTTGSAQNVLKGTFIWPATSVDGFCSSSNNCSGNIEYGSLWGLPQSTYTDFYINNSMGLTSLGKRLARQMRNYGGYFIDTGGGRPTRSDQNITTAKRTEFNAQMQLIYPHLRRITNSTQSQSCSGGGNPLGPNNAYDSPSIFNGPFGLTIPSNPTLVSNSAGINTNQAGRGHIMDIYDFGVAIWDATAQMQKYVVNVLEEWGPNVFETYPCPLTSSMVPSGGSDAAMCVIDWTNRLSYEFWQYNWNGGNPQCSWGAVYSLDSDGSDSVNHEDGPVGAGLSRLAGVVRISELANGLITHPLVFASEMSGSSYLYPANKSDGVSVGPNLFAEGHRLQLNPSVDVDALSTLDVIKTIARALQTYGAYCIDNSGGGIGFIFEMPHPGDSDPYPGWGIEWDYFGLEDIPWNQCRILNAWNGA